MRKGKQITEIQVPGYECARCDNKWYSRSGGRAKSPMCSKCNSKSHVDKIMMRGYRCGCGCEWYPTRKTLERGYVMCQECHNVKVVK